MTRLGSVRLFLAAGVAFCMTASCLAQSSDMTRGNPALSLRGKYIDQRIAEFMDKNGVPGLTMAIVQAPYIPRSAGYGRASVTDDELASTRTMWNIGPLTQGFTAVAVFQLYEAGKLNIRDPVDKYVANLPTAWGKPTLFEVLQHASGLPDYRTSPNFKDGQSYKPAELIALVADKPPLFKAGTDVRQSATDFLLLGLAIERASSRPRGFIAGGLANTPASSPARRLHSLPYRPSPIR